MTKIRNMIAKIVGRRSLRWSMIRMLLISWLCPLLLLTILMSGLVTAKINYQIRRTTVASVETAEEVLRVQFEASEIASKDASYRGVIREAYENYQADGNRKVFRGQIRSFLRQQYQFDSNLRAAILVFPEYPEEKFYCFHNSKGGTYKDIEFFKDNLEEKLVNQMEELDTDTKLISYQERIYMVRNLVDSKFYPYALLALELDTDSLKRSFSGIWGRKNITVYQEGEAFLSAYEGEEVPLDSAIQKELVKNKVIFRKSSGTHSFVYLRTKMYGDNFDFAIRLDNSIVYAEINTILYVFLMLLLFMIPLVFIIFFFFHKRVNQPVQELVGAFDIVTEGQFGIQINENADSEEFESMKKSFNHMSTKLKEQFEKIYKEEIALRDARIMALQSQINPHFLNNTLEIINWEARLNENYKVSQMIEALSTMLEASMNRRSQPYNTVAEEMVYVDAYLYIITQRFGEKFKYQKKVDESLLNIKIPKLIVQPIVENAVEHGMDISRQGSIEIRLYKREKGVLCIEVEDNGTLSEADEKRIHLLLTEELNPLNEKHVSLGIRNVDRRLRMLYGEEFGLFIQNNNNRHTVSTILVKIDEGTEQ